MDVGAATKHWRKWSNDENGCAKMGGSGYEDEHGWMYVRQRIWVEVGTRMGGCRCGDRIGWTWSNDENGCAKMGGNGSEDENGRMYVRQRIWVEEPKAFNRLDGQPLRNHGRMIE